MDKCIDIYVNGSYLRKNHNKAGVQGEGNVTTLHITFDESWLGLAKKITFWDSRKQNPVERTLTIDLLVDVTKSLLEYNVLIPAEPLAHEGEMIFIIDGYEDGKRQRSLQDNLMVEAALIADNAGKPVDPTPTQAEQLQKSIDNIVPEMLLVESSVINAASRVEKMADEVTDIVRGVEALRDETYISSKTSESYAVGGTGTRIDEDIDNAKYYASIAKDVVSGDFVTSTEIEAKTKDLKKVYIQNAEPNDSSEWVWLKTTER